MANLNAPAVKAFHYLEDLQVGQRLGAANVVDGDNARVVELGQGAGLAQVLLGVVGAPDALGAGDLDGHVPVEINVAGEVDAPEASLAEPPDDPVAADHRGIG